MTEFLHSLFIDIDGTTLTDEDERLLSHSSVAGVILFSRNFTSKDQLKKLVERIRKVNPGLLLAVDQEGGRVQRFKDGFTLVPPMGEYGKAYLRDKSAALTSVKNIGVTLASELKAVGIDITFAPVLDLDRGLCEVVGDRAFSGDPAIVADLASALVSGFQEVGVTAVGKHFPGHGNVDIDSHLDIPVDEREFNEIQAADLLPFQAMIRLGLEAIMPAHIIFPKVDTLPACFSKRWLTDVLRGECGFSGAIFSDDMSMEGAKSVGDLPSRVQLAHDAGCNYVLVCNDRPGVLSLLPE